VPAVPAANIRSCAEATEQFAGAFGLAKRTSARTLWAGPLDWTLRTESEPLFALEEPWSIQLSAFAVSVTGAAVQSGRLTVHACVAGVASVLPATSVARTRSSCAPTASPL
jgi:hypothetical protein